MPEQTALDDLLAGLVDGQAALTERLAELELHQSPETSLVELYASFRGLLGLRGLWLAGPADTAGSVPDVSGLTRTLTFNGNPTLNVFDDQLAYWDLDGAGDYFSRADEAMLDILGTEATIAASLRGLTMGGWFWTDSTAAATGLMEKGNAYLLYVNAGGAPLFQIRDNLGAFPTITAGAALATGVWNFVVGRFRPGVALDLKVNGMAYTQAAATSASITNSVEQLTIGARFTPGNYLDGRWAMAFLCAAALPDALIARLFNRTRAQFGV